MRLRHKFGLLAAIYISSLVCNFALCAWCIVLYYDTLLHEFGAAPAHPEWVLESGPGGAVSEPQAEHEEPPPGADVLPAISQPAEAGGRIESLALGVLLVNAVLGLALSAMGPLLVGRWVVRPVADLRGATQRIAGGDWAFRIRPRSGDELGLLAGEVNEMMAALTRLQERLREQERRITVAEALRCVVHNIRSPLTGIRWLAEVMTARLAHDHEVVAKHDRMIAIVDEVIGWLQELRQAHAPPGTPQSGSGQNELPRAGQGEPPPSPLKPGHGT